FDGSVRRTTASRATGVVPIRNHRLRRTPCCLIEAIKILQQAKDRPKDGTASLSIAGFERSAELRRQPILDVRRELGKCFNASHSGDPAPEQPQAAIPWISRRELLARFVPINPSETLPIGLIVQALPP